MHTGPDMFPEHDDLDLTLLERHWLGETSPAEAAYVEAWLLAHPERRTAAFADDERARRTAAILQAAAVPAQHLEPRVIRIPLRGQSRGWAGAKGWRWAAIAGVAAASLAIMVWSPRHNGGAVAVRTQDRVYATTAGQRASVTLRDGTRVTLAPGSRLTIADDFGAASRTVSLSGEAYFDVTHDPAHPFQVVVGNTTTRVLGTAFGVRRYASDTMVEIPVRHGLVAVNDVPVAAGQMGTVGRSGHTVLTPNAPIDERLAWMRGALVFRAMPLDGIVAELSRWYNVEFVLRDPGLHRQRLTLTFDNSSLEEMMNVLAQTLEVSVKREGSRIIIPAKP